MLERTVKKKPSDPSKIAKKDKVAKPLKRPAAAMNISQKVSIETSKGPTDSELLQ